MNHDPASERLRAMASDMEASTTPERADMIAARSMARARASVPRRRSLVAAVAGAALAFAGAMGVGAIADRAAPGQALYGVDRAYESAARFVGVNSDRSAERLEEALKVIDRGDRVAAAKLVDEAVAELQRVRKLATPDATTTTAAAPAATTRPQISAAPAEDPAQTLKLAVERLLRTVRGTEEDDLEAAASEAVLAATAATAPEPGVTVEATTTTTTTPSSTTTSTIPASTSTTFDDGNNGKGNDSTTTTVPSSTTSLPPIILPPQP